MKGVDADEIGWWAVVGSGVQCNGGDEVRLVEGGGRCCVSGEGAFFAVHDSYAPKRAYNAYDSLVNATLSSSRVLSLHTATLS